MRPLRIVPVLRFDRRGFGAAVLCICLFSGCGTARRGAPFYEPLEIEDANVEQGRKAFMQHCHKCHPEGQSGLGPALNNKPLPGPAMRLQIRQGLGSMPAFSEEEISDDEVERIVDYLNFLQAQNPPE